MRKGGNSISLMLLCAFIGILGCQTNASPEEVGAYINDESNGLKKVAEVNGTKVSVIYRPSELMVYQRFGAATDSNRVAIEQELKKWSDKLYFKLSLSRGDRPVLASMPSQQAYSELINTLTFGLGPYQTMVQGTDTLRFLDAQFARTYGKGYSDDILFVYKQPESENSESMVLTLEEFGLHTGRLRFRFDPKDIQRIPKIY